MSQKNTTKSIIYHSFSKGVELRDGHSGEANIGEMVNFRIDVDGSLVKREGYGPIYSAPHPITAIWGGVLDGAYQCFFVMQSSVYRLQVHTGEPSLISELPDFSGPVNFFFFKDSLLLYTSSAFYKITPTEIAPVFGYIPLYGKDWGTTYAGEINEPVNILNGYVRISYRVPDSYSILLPTGRPPLLVAAVYKNGVLLGQDEYSIDLRFNAISVPLIAPGDELLAVVAFDVTEHRNRLYDCSCNAVFGGINNCRLFMWGNEHKNLMFASQYVSDKQFAESQSVFSDGLVPLYFPENMEFTVGNGQYPIESVMRHYDRLLIFTSGDAWMADTSACDRETIPIMNINSAVGCASPCGAIKYGNSPITAWGTEIYRWTSDTDELNDCNAYPISKQLNGSLSADYISGCILFKHPHKSEMWIHNPRYGSNVWIYDLECGAWFKYDGIEEVSAFFDADNQLGFVSGNRIYGFSPDHFTDTKANGTQLPIEAHILFYNLDFGNDGTKRLSEVICTGEGGKLTFEAKLDSGQEISRDLPLGSLHSICQKRLASDRFNSLYQVKLSTSGDILSRQTIHNLKIYAR